jgi:hypothetical protein
MPLVAMPAAAIKNMKNFRTNNIPLPSTFSQAEKIRQRF